MNLYQFLAREHPAFPVLFTLTFGMAILGSLMIITLVAKQDGLKGLFSNGADGLKFALKGVFGMALLWACLIILHRIALMFPDDPYLP
jgi:hypothetical protein